MDIYRIARYRSDARRSGLYQGPGPAWAWGYIVVTPDGKEHNSGSGLASARSLANRLAWPYPRSGKAPEARLFEDWEGGDEFDLGLRGGWRLQAHRRAAKEAT